jgi:hypothetical protein
MRSLRSVRRGLYRSASILGDVNAVASGRPDKMVKRLVRKKVTPSWMGLLNRMLR